MREKWNRATAELQLSNDELTQLIKQTFPGRRVIASELAKGGLANTNIKLILDGDQPPLLLRMFLRDPAQALKERRIYQLIHGTVPAPQVFHFANDNPVTAHPYILMAFVDGCRLESKATTMTDAESRELGLSVGAALAAIHSHRFPDYGFLNSDLKVIEPLPMGGQGLVAYTRRCLSEEQPRLRLGSVLSDELEKFVEREAGLLDQWKGSPGLTHCDFGGSNILVTSITGNWKVAAVLDWEFAISATPFFDLGNLLRKPLGTNPIFKNSVHEGYTTSGGTLPERWYEMSLLNDLTAWLEFMTRSTVNEHLIEDARRNIRETIDWLARS